MAAEEDPAAERALFSGGGDVCVNPKVMEKEVFETYGKLADDPQGKFHFWKGRDYATGRLGYDEEEISDVPSAAVDRFCGLGNPLAFEGAVKEGDVILDHACGSGFDSIIAAKRTGPTGHVHGVDLLPKVRRVATEAVREAGLVNNVSIHDGRMESVPFADDFFDVVISNGTLNLAHDKVKVVREVLRVLKPGGRFYLADGVFTRRISEKARADPELWAA